MNQRFISVAPRLIAIAILLLGQFVAVVPTARCQPPMVIPPGAATPNAATHRSEDSNPAGPYYTVTGVDDHLKMVINTSRFLTLDKKIPQVQVNNPDVLDVMPISPNQVQISAKRTGVTQVNLWGDDKRIYTVTVVVTGDAAELTEVLRNLFPKTSLKIDPVNGTSVVISGYVDQQDAVPKIVSVAGKYFPDVINNMTVSGVQQGMLQVKVIEVSRTKLRNMGFDWAQISSNGNLVWSGVNGLLSSAAGRRLAVRLRATRRTTYSSSTSAGPMPSTACSMPSARTILPSWIRNRTSWPTVAGPRTCWWAASLATPSPTP